MRGTLGAMAAALLAACGEGVDAAAPTDLGAADGGPASAGDGGGGMNGGADAGWADAGPRPSPLPSGMTGARVYGAAQGLPYGARGVGEDQGGNVWAVSPAGLHVLRRGSGSFETFTGVGSLGTYEALSVAGGRPGQVYVGYKGLFGCCDDADDPALKKSGDADLFALDGAGVTLIRHLDIHKANTEKDRTVLTIVFDPDTGNVWFGMNHGLAMWDDRYQVVQDHRHPEYAVGASIKSSDMHGVALDARGSVWMGMAYRTGILAYGATGDFWGRMLDPSPIDVWPAGQSAFPAEEDHVHGIAVEHAGVAWVAGFGNGLARVDVNGGLPSIRYFRRSEGLPSEKLTDVVVDPDGTVWGGTSDAGLFRLQPATGQVRTYLAGHGIADLHLVPRAGGGRTLYVATRGGIVIYEGP